MVQKPDPNEPRITQCGEVATKVKIDHGFHGFHGWKKVFIREIREIRG
jgi:hypothetical protein